MTLDETAMALDETAMTLDKTTDIKKGDPKVASLRTY